MKTPIRKTRGGNYVADCKDLRSLQLQDEMRATPAGRLLIRCGFEPYDTESSARRVAEKAAAELELAADRLAIMAKYNPAVVEEWLQEMRS